jgi:hypothetical protein
MEGTDRRAGFRLIPGGLQSEMKFGPIRIVAAPEKFPPFEVDARAYEEDTFLIMSADPVIAFPEEHPIRMWTQLIETQPEPIGSVRVKGQNPLRFLAIVHDVNQDPTWKEEWVETAIREIFREAEQRKLCTIGLPLLGTLHGTLQFRRFIELLGQVLKQTCINHLKRLWLIVPAGTNSDEILRLF